MTFDDLEVGRHYYTSEGTAECVDLGDKCLMRGEDFFHEGEVTDITPVPTREQWEALTKACRLLLKGTDRGKNLAMNPMQKLAIGDIRRVLEKVEAK